MFRYSSSTGCRKRTAAAPEVGVAADPRSKSKMAAFNMSSASAPTFGSTAANTGGSAFGGLGTGTTGVATSQGTTGFPSFGGFGTNPTTTTGFGFGTNPTTTTSGTAFGFGNLGSLGTTATTSTGGTNLFGGFGGGTGTTSSAPSFSFSGLGTTTTAPGFGGGTTLGTGSMFGSTAAPFGTGTLGSFGTGGIGSGTGTGTFGTGTFPLAFSSSFGTNYGSTLGGGGLSSTFGQGSTFGPFTSGGNLFASSLNPLPSLGQGAGVFGQSLGGANTSQALTSLATALSCPIVFGDERDIILAKWNKLQAFWGTGKGFYSSNGQFVELTADNPFCRFKAIGYSCIPLAKNEAGLVALTINKRNADVISQQQQLVDSLHRILGSKATLSVCVEGVKPLPDNKTEVIMYVLERAPTGASRRIPTSEAFAFLSQPNVKNQLIALGIEDVIPKSAPTKEQLQQYLDNPPSGIDPLLWQQAKLDNPDTEHLIPVPMVGFSELQLRLKYQEQETKQHQGRLDLIAEDISELQRSHTNTVAKIAEQKRKQLELGHRVLQVMVKQETCRKLGYAIQVDEEQLRAQLEAIMTELSAPTQFKGRLNELMSQIRMQNQQTLLPAEERYNIDNNMLNELRQVLRNQQDGLSHLIKVIRSDMEDLRLIEQGLKENGQPR